MPLQSDKLDVLLTKNNNLIVCRLLTIPLYTGTKHLYQIVKDDIRLLSNDGFEWDLLHIIYKYVKRIAHSHSSDTG